MSNDNKNFAEFTKQLQDGLQKEVLRRKSLKKSDSIITNHPNRGTCRSFQPCVAAD